ncbi:class I adenylate-forming enzyme family protein [Novosphingobium beihaiensis]|uniref:AMP-binding protein n=1 Tax=Novosphingobium beihaiensis TaxID=2930389 RepID=A0ABT0BRV3_9SPHN|nr:AMP-binding protein [Novosphingobium beihaiensis]MCJ2187608.1 AMP-binding protein [Novosphingobium beihaiensis]
MSDTLSPHPWLSLYGDAPAELQPARGSVLDLFRDAVKTSPGATAIIYFDRRLTYSELDEASEALAGWLLEQGTKAGDRVAVVLQNDPQFVIAMLAAWKAGAVPVPMNPMYRTSELTGLFGDCAPRFIFCYANDADVVQKAVDAAGSGSALVVCSPRNYQSRDDERVLPPECPVPDGYISFPEAIEAGKNRPVPAVSPASGDLGLILYTSGTTGKPKGAMARHHALAFNGNTIVEWCELDADTRILAIAPLFHITGVVCHVAAAFAAGCSMILNYRFEAASVLDAIRSARPTYTIGAITVFNALMNTPGAQKDDFGCFESVYSGGAPIPPSLRTEFLERMGLLIHTSYGMTETSAPTHLCPLEVEAPVDPESGALAIGIPVYNTEAKVIDEQGHRAPPGVAGELCLKGPQITMGYWNQPDQTAEALVDGWLHSGDIAVMDEAGWFYLVDRKKDVIIASGFKVWPREVEDVLYTHPAVRETAVIGVADPYRGETVKAYVSLKPDAKADPAEFQAYCKERLASYKVPKMVEVLDDLPKTVTGKIQRNVLRDQNT